MKTGPQEASLPEQRGSFAQEIRESLPTSLRGHRAQSLKRQDPGMMESSKPQSTMHEDSRLGKARTDNTLVRPTSMARFDRSSLTTIKSVYEEVSDQLPSTQLISSPRPSTSRQYLKQPRVSSPNLLHSSSLLQSAGRPSKRRHDERSIKYPSVNIVPQFNASPLQPPSSASGSTYEVAHASATSSKGRTFVWTARQSKPE